MVARAAPARAVDRFTDARAGLVVPPVRTPSRWPIMQLLSRSSATDPLDRDAIVRRRVGVRVARPPPRLADRVAVLLGLSDGQFRLEGVLWARRAFFNPRPARLPPPPRRRPASCRRTDARPASITWPDGWRGRQSCLILGPSRTGARCNDGGFDRGRVASGDAWSGAKRSESETNGMHRRRPGDSCSSRGPDQVGVLRGEPLGFLQQALLTWVDAGVIVLGPGGWGAHPADHGG